MQERAAAQASESGDRPEPGHRADFAPTGVTDLLLMKVLSAAVAEGVAKFAGPVGANNRALDVGCGEQPARRLIEARGLEYKSLDVAQNRAGNVDFLGAIDADLEAEILAASPFAFILCTEVLEHVADWPRAFENLTRLMAPGGRLLITCPHVWPLHGEPYDFWRPTHLGIRHYAGRYGLRVVDERLLGDWYDVHGTVVGHANFGGIGIPGLRFLSRKAFGLARRGYVRVLGLRWMRRMFPVESNFFLSVSAVLEKPG